MRTCGSSAVGSLYVHTSDAAAALACSWRTVAGTVPVQSFDKRPFYYVDDVEVTYFENFYVVLVLVLVQYYSEYSGVYSECKKTESLGRS